MNTRDRKLVNNAHYNAVWVIGFSAENSPRNKDAVVQNLLDLCLVQVRKENWEDDAAK